MDEPKRYIHDENGERVGEIHVGDKLIRKNSIDSFNKQNAKIKMEGNFIMRNQENSINLSKQLNNTEIAFLHRITDYLKYNNCMIFKDDYSAIRTIQEFVDLTFVSKTTVIRIIKKFKDLKLLYKTNNHKYNYYFINPYVVFKGDDIQKSIDLAKNYCNIDIEKIIIKNS